MAGDTITPRRGRPPRISREQIIDVGLAIARARGISAVTMTSVAAELDVAVPSLYHHVTGREELLGLVGRSLVDRSKFAVDGDLPWTEWLFAFAHAIRLQVLHEPTLGVVPHLSAHGLLSIPALERGVDVLTRAGFERNSAFSNVSNIVSAVLSTVYRDHCVAEEQAAGRPRIATFLDALHQVPRDEAPLLWALADSWDELRPDAQSDPVSHFNREVRLLIAGMEAELEGGLVIEPVRTVEPVDPPAPAD